MIFSLKKSPDLEMSEPASSLFRVIQQLLEAYALHCVEFDQNEKAGFRMEIRSIANRFEKVDDYRDLLILAGETNKTVQAYNQLVEKFIRELSVEKQAAVEVLAQSLLRICNSSDKAAQNLRTIERELAKASKLEDMRELRAKLTECVAVLCQEAEAQEAQFQELKDRIASSSALLEPLDTITGLPTLKSAEAKMIELSSSGQTGYVMALFLKNVDVVNRRFGYSAGDEVLRCFASYVGKRVQGKDQLFRWRGPCFVVIGNRATSLESIQAEAYNLGVRGPEMEVEHANKSMLLRLTAATTAFLIPKAPGRGVADLSKKIDQFAAEQFKLAPSPPAAP